MKTTRATVTNVNDPEKRGRIRVKCPALYGSEECPVWVHPFQHARPVQKGEIVLLVVYSLAYVHAPTFIPLPQFDAQSNYSKTFADNLPDAYEVANSNTYITIAKDFVHIHKNSATQRNLLGEDTVNKLKEICDKMASIDTNLSSTLDVLNTLITALVADPVVGGAMSPISLATNTVKLAVTQHSIGLDLLKEQLSQILSNTLRND